MIATLNGLAYAGTTSVAETRTPRINRSMNKRRLVADSRMLAKYFKGSPSAQDTIAIKALGRLLDVNNDASLGAFFTCPFQRGIWRLR